MEPENLSELIKNHPFLKNLDEKHLDTLLSCVTNVRFKEGEYVAREGKPADQFFLIRNGRLVIEINALERGTLQIQTVNQGEVLGWSWLIPPYKWRFDVRALEDVRAFALDGKCLRTKCDEHTDFGYEMLKRFSQIIVQRLEATRIQLIDVYGSGGKH